jgi:uncharacterized phage-associated protein
MGTSARAVANEFIRLAAEDRRSLTPLQLIKLVYIAHGWMLALYHRPLINDRIEAWKYGPVIPDLYRELKKYGAGSVPGEISEGRFSSTSPLDEHEKDLVRQVYEIYGKKTGVQLSQLTHERGTPWAATWEPDSMGIPISNDLIAEHYRRLTNEREHSSSD